MRLLLFYLVAFCSVRIISTASGWHDVQWLAGLGRWNWLGINTRRLDHIDIFFTAFQFLTLSFREFLLRGQEDVQLLHIAI